MSSIGIRCFRLLHTEIRNLQGSKVNLVARRSTGSFRSAYALANLYPNSSLALHTPSISAVAKDEKFSGYIPLRELDITYSRSSGPGGQNVNKVNTKVHLKFHVKNATFISDEIKEKLVEQCRNKINKEGYLILKSDITRSQQLNLADALEKLRSLIRKTLETAPETTPETMEEIRKRQMKAARERVFVKRMRSDVKQSRQAPIPRVL